MSKRTIISVAVLVAIAGGVIAFNPALRAKFSQRVDDVTGWDEQARRADPVGFAEYAEQKLRQDLEAMQKTRRELAAEVGQIARKVREQEALANHAQSLAGDFRSQFQLASTIGRFPIEVRGAAYTEDQARSQVSMLLAEAEGYQASLAELRKVQQQAEAQIEALVVKVDATESQLATLATKRELLRAQQLTAEGERLLAQVDQLLADNAQFIEGNPVRTVQELLAAGTGRPGKPSVGVDKSRVLQFLNGTISFKPGPDDVELIEVSERAFDRENLESESPHTPIQVQGDITEFAGKIETKSKETGEK